MDLRHKEMMEAVINLLPEKDRPDISSALDEMILGQMKHPEIKVHPSMPEYKVAPPFTMDGIAWIYDNWRPRKGDVLVATFPKTGTTWVREICHQIVHGNDEISSKVGNLVQFPTFAYLECGSKTKYSIMDKIPLKRRVFGTHAPSELINVDAFTRCGAKIIYVMRNPKDTIISFKKFLEGMPWLSGEGIKEYFPDDWDEFIKMLISGQMPTMMKEGEWYPQHIRSWLKYRGNQNVHIIYYEDLKKDPKKEIATLSKFLDTDLSDEQLKLIVSKTSFQSMKAHAGPMETVKMFRKGGVGNWKEHFTVTQSEMVDRVMTEQLGAADVQFVYEL